MPEGMSVDSGLKGLTNADGSDLPTGTNRHGVGEDSILDGRLGANSPRDAQRNPLGELKGADSGGKPPGAELGSRAPNWDLVGADPEEFEIPEQLDTPAPPLPEPPDAPPEEERNPPTPPPPGDGPIPEPKPDDPGPLRSDPDAVAGGDRRHPARRHRRAARRRWFRRATEDRGRCAAGARRPPPRPSDEGGRHRHFDRDASRQAGRSGGPHDQPGYRDRAATAVDRRRVVAGVVTTSVCSAGRTRPRLLHLMAVVPRGSAWSGRVAAESLR